MNMTGADESIDPEYLSVISRNYPFVEWGILFSEKEQGKPKYPQPFWLNELSKIAQKQNLGLSAHLCGKWAREMIEKDRYSFCWSNNHLIPMFQRIQFNGNFTGIEPQEFTTRISRFHKTYIIQRRTEEDNHFFSSLSFQSSAPVTVFPLFDNSGGTGTSPSNWLKPVPGMYNGYAGGLGPDNLEEQLKQLSEVVGNEDVWIDMETNIRTKDKFDMEKVKECLEFVFQNYIAF